MKLASRPSTAIHPEATADPATLRWVVSGVSLPFAGELVSAPGLDEFLGRVHVEVTVGAVIATVLDEHLSGDGNGAPGARHIGDEALSLDAVLAADSWGRRRAAELCARGRGQ